MKKVRGRTAKVIEFGKLIKENNFDTRFGRYTIRIILYSDDLYFLKLKDGATVECVNLNKLCLRGI